MSEIRKAVIPAAGYGTGFLPATKAQPKELLPIVDKPVIQFIVEEALESGIEEILIITGRHKRSIEDHFDSNPELEDNLETKGKQKLLDIVRQTTKANLFFVRQDYPHGLADAIYKAKAFVDNEPFAVMLGDNIFESQVPVTKQLIDVYKQYKVSNVAVMDVPEDKVDKYGIVEPEDLFVESPQVYRAKSFIEKPSLDQTSSRLSIAGRYVLGPEIFNAIDQIQPGVEGELQLTDAINLLNHNQRVFATMVDAYRFDVGDKMGYMNMSLHYGLQHPETKDEFKDYLIRKSRELTGQ